MRLTGKIIFFLIFVTAFILFLAFQEQTFHKQVKNIVISLANQEVLGETPLVVEDLRFQFSFRNFFRGYLSELSILARIGDFHIDARGPLKYNLLSFRSHNIIYLPNVKFETEASWSDQISVEINLNIDRGFNQLLLAVFKFEGNKWQWPALNLNLKKIVTNGQFIPPNIFVANIDAKDFKLKSMTANALSLSAKIGQEFLLEGSSPLLTFEASQEKILSFQKLSLRLTKQEGYRLKLSNQNLEVLWNDNYFDIPTQNLTLEAIMPEGEKFQQLLLNASIKKNFALTTELEPETPFPFSEWQKPRRYRLHWNSLLTSIDDFVPLLKQWPAVKNWQWRRGELKSAGTWGFTYPSIATHNLSGKLSGKDLELVNSDLGISLRGLDLEIPYSKRIEQIGSVELKDFSFRHFSASIPPARFSLADGFRMEQLKINIPHGRIVIDKTSVAENTFQATMSAEAQIAPLMRQLCLGVFPEGKISAKFPSVNIQEGDLKATGEIQADFLGGAVKVKNIKSYHVLGNAPETHFDGEAKSISLNEINRHLDFGKMEGFLEADLKNVVMLGLLPTQFNFKVQVRPEDKRQVVFSSQAMKNFIQLFTPEDFQKNLPSWLNFFAFGWPSDLIGGYNINYAGVSLYSHSGSILLETLDPVDVVEEEKKHFILNGPRFKVPLQSRQYPVVLDAYGITNFVQHLKSTVSALNKNKSKEEEDDPCK